jgi:hypothetical protein
MIYVLYYRGNDLTNKFGKSLLGKFLKRFLLSVNIKQKQKRRKKKENKNKKEANLKNAW